MAEMQQIRKFRDFLQGSKHRVNILYGGAGSGKSYSVAQHFIVRFFKERNKRFLIIRKTLPALRITAYQLVLDLLEEYNMTGKCKFNRSELTITRGSNKILFKGLDDPEKVKSYEGNYIWIEEATDVTWEDFVQLRLRLRRTSGEGTNTNQMFLTFNPISRLHWLHKKLVEPSEKEKDEKKKKVNVLHSTYKDNRFLAPEYIEELQGLKDEDEEAYSIYTLGKWGLLKNLIYSNWDTVKVAPPVEEVDVMIYGLDFGFSKPLALMELRIKGREAWIIEKLYRKGMTNPMLISSMSGMGIKKAVRMYADCAEPKSIAEIEKAGFNIIPCRKGPGSVMEGIKAVQSFDLHILEDDEGGTNTVKEFGGYKFKEDRRTGEVLDVPVQFMDHTCDGVRYPLDTHTFDPDKKSFFSKEKLDRIFG